MPGGWLVDRIPPRILYPVAIALWSLATVGLGFVGLAFLSPLLYALQNAFGWQMVFLVTGGVGIVWAAIWFLVYREPRDFRGANYVESPALVILFLSLAFFGNGLASITWSLVSAISPPRSRSSARRLWPAPSATAWSWAGSSGSRRESISQADRPRRSPCGAAIGASGIKRTRVLCR